MLGLPSLGALSSLHLPPKILDDGLALKKILRRQGCSVLDSSRIDRK